ncbi:MAG: phosphoribosylformylglycinamidine cyclo-ligase [Planctomycetota bacterium]
MTSDSLTYKAAGVDIDAQEKALALSKASIKRSATAGVLADVGLFGGLFDPAKMGCGDSVLVASADGVGTKLDVAKKVGIYDTVGRDLVQHCIDDILVQGARPLFFMDYVGTGKLEPEVVAGLIRGCADACTDNGLALLGGETAEMPGLYAEGDFDLVGFIVGAVARDKILDGSRVAAGQVLLGLPSLGLHTNGYSLARMVMFDRLGLALDDKPTELGGRTVAEALLAPHKSYYSALWPLLERGLIPAMAHITGGGLIDNVPRILGGAFDAVFDRDTWERPGLFKMLVEGGQLADDESYRAFNMGIGMVLFVDEDKCEEVQNDLRARGEEVFRIGTVQTGTGVVKWDDGALS